MGQRSAVGIHYGHARATQAARADLLTAAYAAHPERLAQADFNYDRPTGVKHCVMSKTVRHG